MDPTASRHNFGEAPVDSRGFCVILWVSLVGISVFFEICLNLLSLEVPGGHFEFSFVGIVMLSLVGHFG